jgi:DNA-directed RNA polymerase subunit RPC12/RpoP
MSREAYTPNLGAGSSSQQAGGSGQGAFNITGNALEDTSRPVQYLCGDCDSKVTLKKGDAIRCKECGYRVLYKERTNRYVL